MAGYKNSYKKSYKKKSYTTNKKSITKSKSATAQQKQLLSLQRQVKTLAKAEAKETVYSRMEIFQQPVALFPPTSSSVPFNIFKLTEPVNWTPIFSTDERVMSQREATVKSYNLHMKLSPKNSLSTLLQADVQIWLVKLKVETSAQLLDLTDNLNEQTLSMQPNGSLFYANINDAGFFDYVRLNPKFFDIKAYRFCSLQNIMQETETIDDDVNVTSPLNVKKFVSINHRCSTKIVNVRGDPRTMPPLETTDSWSTLPESETSHMDRYYLITHVGGYASPANGIDLSANWTCSVKTEM